MAKSADQQQGLTKTGASMGTALYISPEQAEGKRDIDLRTDISSIGATLDHLLAGAPPYKAQSAISMMMNHVGADIPDVRSVDPSLPATLAEVVFKMLQKAPEDRHGSCAELIAGLHAAHAALQEPRPIPSAKPAVARAATPAPPKAGSPFPGLRCTGWVLPPACSPGFPTGPCAPVRPDNPRRQQRQRYTPNITFGHPCLLGGWRRANSGCC